MESVWKKTKNLMKIKNKTVCADVQMLISTIGGSSLVYSKIPFPASLHVLMLGFAGTVIKKERKSIGM